MVVRQIGVLGLILMVVTVGGIGGLAYAQDNSTNSDNSHIRVSSSGSIDTTPDMAVLNIGIRQTADTPSQARTMTAKRASNTREALSNLEMVENIRTTRFTIREQRKERPVIREHGKEESIPKKEPHAPQNQDTSYIAEHTLEVKINNINEVGTVIDEAINNGATNIDDVRFTLSEQKQDRVKNKALREAMDRARSRADTIASSAGISISGVKSVDASSNFGVAVRQFEAAGGSADTTIEPGPVDVNAQVTVTYNIR